MYYLENMGEYIYADCEKCQHTNKVLSKNCIKRDGKKPEYNLMKSIKCEQCGNESNEIIQKPKIKKTFLQNIHEDLSNMKQHHESVTTIKANEPVHCPKCGSTQITSDRKGFGLGKAVVGDLVAGPVGILAGGIGSKKVILTCLKCGHQWKAGKK